MRTLYYCENKEVYIVKDDDINIKNFKDKVFWLDIKDKGLSDLEFLKNNFNFDELELRHCNDDVERAKLMEYSDHLFLLFTSVSWASIKSNLKAKSVYIFLGENYLITLHTEENSAISDLIDYLKVNPLVMNKGADFLLYELFKSILEEYFIISNKFQDNIEEIEGKIMINPAKEIPTEIMNMKRKVLKLRKSIFAKRELIASVVECDSNAVLEGNKKYFLDTLDHLMIIQEILDNNSEMLTNSLDLYSSQVSSKTNDIMKILTVITTITLPITVLTGIEGMNFDKMPELHYQYGYLIFWILVILSVSIQLIIFKRKKWL